MKDKTWKEIQIACYIGAVICFIGAVGVHFLGLPNLGNLEEQSEFCVQNGGVVMPPTRDTYNEQLCTFNYQLNRVNYVAVKIKNEEWKQDIGYKYDYCFSCWSDEDCSSSHNSELREEGVHC